MSEEGYKPTPDEVVKAGEDNLKRWETISSAVREDLINRLSEEEKGLLKECNFNICGPLNGPSNTSFGTSLEGTIKGHRVVVTHDHGFVSGHIDGDPLTSEEIKEIYDKYEKIAHIIVQDNSDSKGRKAANKGEDEALIREKRESEVLERKQSALADIL